MNSAAKKHIKMTVYNNPRMSATIENWPSGSKRVTATFAIEARPGKGERGTRSTTGATKTLTYARKARIVDGDDGRTYIAELSMYGGISIMQGDMKYCKESFFPNDPRYPDMLALFN